MTYGGSQIAGAVLPAVIWSNTPEDVVGCVLDVAGKQEVFLPECFLFQRTKSTVRCTSDFVTPKVPR